METFKITSIQLIKRDIFELILGVIQYKFKKAMIRWESLERAKQDELRRCNQNINRLISIHEELMSNRPIKDTNELSCIADSYFDLREMLKNLIEYFGINEDIIVIPKDCLSSPWFECFDGLIKYQVE